MDFAYPAFLMLCATCTSRTGVAPVHPYDQQLSFSQPVRIYPQGKPSACSECGGLYADAFYSVVVAEQVEASYSAHQGSFPTPKPCSPLMRAKVGQVGTEPATTLIRRRGTHSRQSRTAVSVHPIYLYMWLLLAHAYCTYLRTDTLRVACVGTDYLPFTPAFDVPLLAVVRKRPSITWGARAPLTRENRSRFTRTSSATER